MEKKRLSEPSIPDGEENLTFRFFALVTHLMIDFVLDGEENLTYRFFPLVTHFMIDFVFSVGVYFAFKFLVQILWEERSRVRATCGG